MQYLRIQDVVNKTKQSKSHIWELAKIGKFPQPINLSSRITVWDADEINIWMREKKEISRRETNDTQA